jgi:hypothetical protein
MFSNVSRSRLLPMSLPFRYFGAAAAFQIAAWATLLAYSNHLLSFEGGLGPVFSALHLLTLGVLAMAAMGATLQLLPMATRQPVRAVGAVKLAWWLLVPGVIGFAWGAALFRTHLMGSGAMTVLSAFVIYAVLLARNLLGARGMAAVVAHGWAALACLVLLAATGLALVARYEHGIALDYAAVRAAHIVLAAYGFMGLLAFGISGFLLPMLALAPPPPAKLAYGVLGVAIAAIVLGVHGFVAAGALVGLAAVAGHVYGMERSFARRLRPAMGGAFWMMRLSWACLAASLVLAALGFPGGAALFGVLVVPGWLLTFLLGVLSRILPFLASVHASTSARGTPLISALTPERVLAAHRALHVAALAGLVAACVWGEAWLARAGALAGLAAAAVFAAFFAFIVFKVRNHGIPAPHQPAPA